MNKRISFLITLFILGTGLAVAQQKYTALKSGEPIKNGNANGIGRLSLPFYNGFTMGFADVQGKGKKDLFLQGTDGSGRGTYLYAFKKLSPEGVPVFAAPIKITLPFEDKGDNRGLIHDDGHGKIIGLWSFGQTLKYAEFNKTTYNFSTLKSISVKGIPRGFSDYGIIPLKDGRYLFLFAGREEGVFSNGKDFPKMITYNAEGFWPYEIAKLGIYGAVSETLEPTILNPKPLTALDQALFTIDGFVKYTNGNDSYVIAGTRIGNLLVYKLNEKDGTLGKKQFGVDDEGVLLRNPDIHASVGYFYDSEENQGLITVGEGGIYYYQNTRKIDKNGNLVMKDSQHLLQENPNLYAGSLVVPTIIDWDGDQKLDMIVGNSMGFIFFYKNMGTNEQPLYGDPEYLKADGKTIHVQPGYREDIQGPGEARWGYTCPNVIDWNGDGLLDILTGDSRGKFMVYLNIGTKTNPKLDREHTLYIDGMDLYGTWRVRPGVSKIGDKMAYIITDRDDEFHLYWQLDKYNVSDGGKLKINNQNIRGNKLGGGTVGRSRFEIVDWDEDGVKDLLVGTYGKQSIPDTLTGLPFNMKPKRGSTILFLKNVGTDLKPKYEYPKVLKFKGKNISVGGHECAPSTAMIGPGKQLNLVIGIETGTIIFYDRKDLTW